MRVISGSARGMKLKKVPGESTRPIMDRVKENLFNLIDMDYVNDAHWLDLFAGTGQVGIEALSRGAAHVTFLDKVRPAIKVIQENLAHTKMTDAAMVRHADAFLWLESAAPTPLFDVIYVAPPQYHGVWVGAMSAIQLRIDDLLKEDGMVIVQIDPREYQPIDLAQLQLEKERTYGNTILLFYKRLTQ